jgi:CRISPR/Cas system CSM-associated protein Csm3 (group 7 of RAMP superfamily)
MTEATLTLQLHSFWHAGSGRGRSAVLDAEVARDDAGLPFLPGKSVKGLLRKAATLAEHLGEVPSGTVERLFGSDVPGLRSAARATDDAETDVDDHLPETDFDDRLTPGDVQTLRLEQGRFATTPGALWFGSAMLPEAWRAWARTRDGAATARHLARVVASTAIDRTGVAREGTLRVFEVAVPMTLEATLVGPDGDDAWIPHLKAVLPWLRAVGSKTSRGYGRVTASLAVKTGGKT